jgi:hypothetical protein
MVMRKSLAIVSILVVLASGCGGGSSSSGSAESAGPASTAVTSSTQPPVAQGPPPACTYAGLNDSGNMQVEVTFTNPLGEVNEVAALFALFDGEGGPRFYTASDVIVSDLGKFPRPGEQFRVNVRTIDELPPGVNEATITCKVLEVEESTSISGYKRATDADTCTVIGTDPAGGVQVDLSVTSPYEETTKVQTWWALEAPGPVRFGTDTEVTDLVAAGETYRITPEFGKAKPAWVGDGQVTCSVLGFWDQGS